MKNGLRSDRLLLERARPITARRIAPASRRFGADAGVGHVTAHQLRHTLATQAVNRGMSLDATAALLGPKTLAMTMVYARIADKTVAPVDMDCHFESICETCTFFVTTIAFRATVRRQRDDAERRGQVARQKIFNGLLTRLDDQEAS